MAWPPGSDCGSHASFFCFFVWLGENNADYEMKVEEFWRTNGRMGGLITTRVYQVRAEKVIISLSYVNLKILKLCLDKH